MKRFRTITAITLVAIFLLVAGNIFYLGKSYSLKKDEVTQTVKDCARRAYMMEVVSRMRDSGGRYGNDESFIRVNLTIQGEPTPDGGYEYPDMLNKVEESMGGYFGFIAGNDTTLPPVDTERLRRFFISELAACGIPTDKVETDTAVGLESDGLRVVDFNPGDDRVYKARLNMVDAVPFIQMSGIIVTSGLILLLIGFLIWYLLRQVGRLRSIEQMKDDFTHNMTHELKTPVAVAYSAADSMSRYYDPADEERNKRLLNIIMERLNFLSGMIENILSMSMERFKKMKISLEDVAVRSIVENVAEMMKLKAQKPVVIDIDIPEGMTVTADPLHFGNVITNLLDNALKYSGDRVKISVITDGQSLRVADNGIGISPTHLPYIFDKFYRVTDGDRYEVGGYGLGLYYVRQIVARFGWQVTVESEPGRGSAFTIRFDNRENSKL